MSATKEQLAKCQGCKEAREVIANDGWGFIGCAMRGRQWIAQIEECELRDRPRETILEKVKKKNPVMNKKGFPVGCPSDYGFEDCDDFINDNGFIECKLSCPECWNREVEK